MGDGFISVCVCVSSHAGIPVCVCATADLYQLCANIFLCFSVVRLCYWSTSLGLWPAQCWSALNWTSHPSTTTSFWAATEPMSSTLTSALEPIYTSPSSTRTPAALLSTYRAALMLYVRLDSSLWYGNSLSAFFLFCLIPFNLISLSIFVANLKNRTHVMLNEMTSKEMFGWESL